MKKIFLILPLLLIIISGCSWWGDKNVEKQENSEQVSVNQEENKQENIGEEQDREMLAADYVVDMDKTRINWGAERIVGNSHKGSINLKEAKIVFNEDSPFVGSKFIIDMSTIQESKNNNMVVKHIKSADFFDVETYPIAELVVKAIDKLEDEKYNITADLTIKNITNEINFVGQVVSGSEEIEARTEFSIDRSKWDVRYGSGSFFDNLGDDIIRDEIEFTVDLFVNKQ